MVYRWQCRNCDYSVWSADDAALTEAVESHLLEHYESQLSKSNYLYEWSCPYCDAAGTRQEMSTALREFKSHLFDHVEPLVESDVHLADDIQGVGDVLVKSSEPQARQNARIHLLSPADVVLITTTSPADRIQLIDEHLSEWPAWTIVITTRDNPLGNLDVRLSELPLEIVKLDKRMGLDQLGETISRVLHENDTSNAKVSVEFDILPEIVQKFELEDVFQFLTVLGARLEQVNALAHYYVDDERIPASSINILEELFDVSVRAEGHCFVSE